VYRHLVTVKVSVKRTTHQWVQLDRLAFNQFWLKSLNRQTVQRWSPIKHHRVTLENVFQNLPDHRILTIYQFLR
jgi:hypothetical protein